MVFHMEAELKDRKYSTLKMVEKREIGRQFLRLDTLRSKYYKHMKMSLNSQENHGAIFNMQFSPNGKMLVVACEERAILMYDPNTRKCLHRLPSAHSDCVNCICFCDERIFASGSDDCTIALWDARMLKEQVMNLSGHTGWVKSLVYVVNSGLLLSSAYDGTVRTWDINRSSNLQDNTGVIFEANDVSRMQLTPDEDKIIISCLNYCHGDIVVIFHNLDLSNFADDVTDKWLKEIPQDYLGQEAARRNIPEVLDTNLEYPKYPLRIPSFQVHPEGSCLVSRYLAMNIEYTTVHDIQQYTIATGGKVGLMLSDIEQNNGTLNFNQLSKNCNKQNCLVLDKLVLTLRGQLIPLCAYFLHITRPIKNLL